MEHEQVMLFDLQLAGLFLCWHLPSLELEREFVVWVLLKLGPTTFYFKIKIL